MYVCMYVSMYVCMYVDLSPSAPLFPSPHTYTQVLDAARQVQQAQASLSAAAAALSCCVQVINSLMKIRFKMREEEFEVGR